jgi:membrane associated rhomboid family serine protease
MRTMVATGQPVVTYGIMALSVVGYILYLIPGVADALVFFPPLSLREPWRILTGLFLHASILQVLFNAYSTWIFGRMLESQLGRVRFGALYLLGGLGGEVAVALFHPGTGFALGGTAAIFGMFAAFFVIQRQLGNQAVQILVILALNVVIGLVLGAPWQAYLGGIAIGALSAYILMQTRQRQALNRQRALLIGLAAVLVVILLVRAASLTTLF